MLINGDRKFVLKPFDDEEELERVVKENSEYLFGPASIYFPKSLITTSDGAGTIPDGYVIDLDRRDWYIVEAELSCHNVWRHIAPQVAKEIVAARNPIAKQKLVDLFFDLVCGDEELRERFTDAGIEEIRICETIGKILAEEPAVAMPIDRVSDDLGEWAATLRSEVKLWIVTKHVEVDDPENVMYEIPEQFTPLSGTVPESEVARTRRAQYDVTIRDLLDEGLLHAGQSLQMSYKPRNGEQREYHGTVCDDGSIEVLGKRIPSVSYAAVHCIQDAGSHRTTDRGWTRWRTDNGELLSVVRDRYLAKSNEARSSGEPEPEVDCPTDG